MLQQSTPSQRLFYAAHKDRMNRLWPAKVCVPPKPPVARLPEPKPVTVILPIDNAQLEAAWKVIDKTYTTVDGMSQSDAVKRAVCAYYGISKDDLVSRRRTSPLIRPRQMAQYILRITTTMSVPQIGRLVGNRDHTTVLYSIEKIQRLAETDAAVAAEIADLKKMLGA